MKLLTKIMSIALLSATACLSAQTCCPTQTNCNPCCDWFEDCEFSVFGEYLYWDFCKRTGDLDRVATPVLGTQANLQFGSDYQSGYRVGGVLRTSCWNLFVRYTSLCPTKTISQSGLLTDELYTEKVNYDYSTLGIGVGRDINLRGLCGTLTPFIGLRFGWIDEAVEIDVVTGTTGPATTNKDTSLSFDAYGVMVGTLFKWELWNECIPVSFVSRASLGLLKGKVSGDDIHRIEDGVITTTTAVYNRCALSFVPSIYVGLEFDLFCCDCFHADAQIGYEAEIWSSVFSSYISLNGLVARFAIGF